VIFFLLNSRTTIPLIFKGCLRLYFDFLSDVDVPGYEKKNYTKFHLNKVQNYFKTVISILDAPDSLMIGDFGTEQVSQIHNYLEKNYAPKTYNHYLSNLKKFFAYLIEINYNIENPFAKVPFKKTEPRTEIIHLDEFERLVKICKPDNGVYVENSGKKKNLYRAWLPDAWRMYLYSGRRRQDVPQLKVSNVFDSHIYCKELKTGHVHLIPMTVELKELITQLIKRDNLKAEDYLIAHEEANRNQVRNISSHAFTHYWKQLNIDREVTLNSLRNTYATYGRGIFGASFEGLFGLHAKVSTTDINYVNKAEAIKKFAGQKMFGS